MADPVPANWFLPYSSIDPAGPTGDGRPWGDGTAMAARAGGGGVPWDAGCRVTTYVDGFAAMSAMRDALEAVIAEAQGGGADKGHVYFSGWRFNCQRELSADLRPWTATNPPTRDQTAIGLVLRLIQAGVRVRLLLWLPGQAGQSTAFAAHVQDHEWAARLVGAESAARSSAGDPLGVVALDLRTADRFSASHHQKTMVIRSGATHLAFVGGVDLGFTRRDPGGSRPGDWQSGEGIPRLQDRWPEQPGMDYSKSRNAVKPPSGRQPTDLPTEVYGTGAEPERQRWHDQHLRVEGSAVQTLEDQFAERWRDWGRAFDLSSLENWFGDQVIFSTREAFTETGIVALPISRKTPPLAGAASLVQMWRTIPVRAKRTTPPFTRGEFTVLAGLVRATETASELIWMFDQYLWSTAYARFLNLQLRRRLGLHVMVILPPHADSLPSFAHEARFRALETLTGDVADRVAVYGMWNEPRAIVGSPGNRGIYVHAKAHTYDGALLVCGSANINRRSLLCDTELACAVLDPQVVVAHQDKLWSELFPGTKRPDIDLQTPGSGKDFFDAFAQAATGADVRVVRDPWAEVTPTLPNRIERPRRGSLGLIYNRVMDPSGLGRALEAPSRDLDGRQRESHIGDWVSRLERHHTASGVFPYRRPASSFTAGTTEP